MVESGSLENVGDLDKHCRGPLGLVRTTEELLEGKSTGSGPENRD
jgi:hypothetical protein